MLIYVVKGKLAAWIDLLPLSFGFLKIGCNTEETFAMEDENVGVADNLKQMSIGKPPRDPLVMRPCISSTRLADSDSEADIWGLTSPSDSDGKPGFLPVFRSGSWSEIGPKTYMEDEHICVNNLHEHLGATAKVPSPGAFYGFLYRYLMVIMVQMPQNSPERISLISLLRTPISPLVWRKQLKARL